MDAARIATLLAPFLGEERLSEQQLSQLSAYLDLLMHWNQRINFTAVRDADNIVTRHFGESLFAARHLMRRDGSAADGHLQLLPDAKRPSSFRISDVGSGAGFPGLPLKIYAPTVRLTLIESNQKKATFLKEVIRALRLVDVNVFAGRAEAIGSQVGHQAELVTIRAVEKFALSLPVAAAMVAPNGRLGLLIGDQQIRQAKQLVPTVKWEMPLLIPLSTARVLLWGRKLGEHEPEV